MILINKDNFPDLPVVVHVDVQKCDGCGVCVDSCSVEALCLTQNPLRPGKRQVVVDSELCMGCGVCQATCPKEALYIQGLSPSDLRSFVHQAICHTP